jgi:hypothetical protein
MRLLEQKRTWHSHLHLDSCAGERPKRGKGTGKKHCHVGVVRRYVFHGVFLP